MRRWYLLVPVLSLGVVLLAASSWVAASAASPPASPERAEIQQYITAYFAAFSAHDAASFYSLAGPELRARCSLETVEGLFRKFPPPTYTAARVVNLTVQGDRAVASVSMDVSAAPIRGLDGHVVGQDPGHHGVTEPFHLVRTEQGWAIEPPPGTSCPMTDTIR